MAAYDGMAAFDAALKKTGGDTSSAKLRKAVAAETSAKTQRDLLASLGVTSVEEAIQKLSQIAPPKAQKSEF